MKNCGCSQDMFVQPPKILVPNSTLPLRNKKDKSAMNSVDLNVHLDFEIEIFGGRTNISCGHP